MSRQSSRPALLLGLLAALALTSACGDDSPAAPDPNTDGGQARFTFSGSGFDGNFEAQGKFERDDAGLMKLQSFATAVDVTLPQYQLAYYGIVAANFYPPVLDDVSILLSGQSEGEYPITSSDQCSMMIDFGAGPCAAIIVDLGINIDGTANMDGASFEFVDGTVMVNSASAKRIKGTFSGMARQFGDWTSGEYYTPGIEVQFTEGTFDVPIILLREWNGAPQLNPNLFSPLRSRVRP